jgi:Flp pilus assembly protein TadD
VNLRKFEEARTLNLQAVALMPKDPLAHAQLGLALLQLGDLGLAETHLQTACRLDPKHFSNPQLVLAELHFRRNDKRKAADQLEDFLKHHPDWAEKERLRETIKVWRQ